MRDRNNQAMTDEMIRRHASSVFAMHQSEDVSAQYKFISTIEVVNALRSAGFEVIQAGQQRAGKAHHEGFQKHVLRLRHRDNIQLGRSQSECMDLVLSTSHMGNAAFVLQAGIFRFVCENGMILADCTVARERVVHKGYSETSLLESATRITDQSEIVVDCIASWKTCELSPGEIHKLAHESALVRWKDADSMPIYPLQLIQPRQHNRGNSPDLWTTFNNIQENLTDGRLQPQKAMVARLEKIRTEGLNSYDVNRPNRTRAVGSVGADLDMNRKLWEIAAKIAKK